MRRALRTYTPTKKAPLLILGEANRRCKSRINKTVKQLPLTRIILAHNAETNATAVRVVQMVGRWCGTHVA